VLVFVVALLLLPADAGGERPEDIAARYADGHAGYLFATYVEALSEALFLIFTAVLSVYLSRHEISASPYR
jgi:hypothetical protein